MSGHYVNNAYVPNTSSIPNILFDYWMYVLTPAEFKVLMCIARKTYGWHKVVDRISLNQIEKMTGLSRFGIVKNVESLISHGLVIKFKSKTSDGDDAPNQFEINVNCIVEGRQLSLPPGRQLSLPQVGNSVDPQKKDLQKKRYTKDVNDNETVHNSSSLSASASASASASSLTSKKSGITNDPPEEQEALLKRLKNYEFFEIKPITIKRWMRMHDYTCAEMHKALDWYGIMEKEDMEMGIAITKPESYLQRGITNRLWESHEIREKVKIFEKNHEKEKKEQAKYFE